MNPLPPKIPMQPVDGRATTPVSLIGWATQTTKEAPLPYLPVPAPPKRDAQLMSYIGAPFRFPLALLSWLFLGIGVVGEVIFAPRNREIGAKHFQRVWCWLLGVSWWDWRERRKVKRAYIKFAA